MAMTTYRNIRHTTGAVIAGIALVAITGCGQANSPNQNTPQRDAASATATGSAVAEATSQQTDQDSPADALDPRIQAYVDAVNDRSLDDLAAAFATDGLVIDVAREITGRAAIREWAGNEVIGGRLDVLQVESHQDGARLLVHWAPSGSDGWRAHYDFDVTADGILRADLQYAD